jgi:hypothetical protein
MVCWDQNAYVIINVNSIQKLLEIFENIMKLLIYITSGLAESVLKISRVITVQMKSKLLSLVSTNRF